MNAVQGDLDAVLVAASGCGHTMKAYGELLNGKAAFRAPVLDVQEFLADRGLLESFRAQLQPLPGVVAMHDACHMIHGQGIQAQPRQLLRAIPNVQLWEATEAGVCCGSAGIYTWCSQRKPPNWAESRPTTSAAQAPNWWPAPTSVAPCSCGAI